jgi:pre-rRNA-processing protein TSR2
MMDEFDVNVDDASGFDVARQIITLRADCARGRTAALDELRTKYQSRKGKKVQAQAAATENDDDDDSDSGSDDSDGAALDWADDANDNSQDVVMDEAPQLVPASRSKPEPEVDDDGFTTVVRRR